MAAGWKVLLIVAAVAAQEDPALYSASLIRYLADQSSDIFDCWFLQLSEDPDQVDLEEELLLSEELDGIPKRFISSMEASRIIERQPKLLLIFGDYHHVIALRDIFACVFYPNFKESVKIIVFHQCTSANEMEQINAVFATAKLFNVVYIRTDQLEVDYCLQYRGEIRGWIGHADFEDLFVDQTTDIDGEAVRVSYSSLSVDSVFSKKKGEFNGRLLEWIIGTVRHVNGTSKFHMIICDYLPEHECFARQHMIDEITTFDFALKMVTNTRIDPQFLDSAIPDQFLVAALRGRQLLVYELFIIPFQPSLWILLITFAIIGCLLMWMFPNLFQNDLILTPLCGFERHTLNKVSRLEQFIIFPSIIITFILSNAYESKIIAFMTSFPTAPNPRSFEDLLKAGITVQVESRNSFGVASDPRFSQVFKYEPSSTKKIDLTNKHLGYSGMSEEIRYFVDHPKSVDPISKLSQLVILDRFSMGIFIPFYFVGRRNPLRNRFRQTEVKFFEAGLMDFWLRKFMHYSFGIDHTLRVSAAGESSANVLGIDKLGPICVVMVIGYGLAALVFVGECLYSLLERNGRHWFKLIVYKFRFKAKPAITFTEN